MTLFIPNQKLIYFCFDSIENDSNPVTDHLPLIFIQRVNQNVGLNQKRFKTKQKKMIQLNWIKIQQFIIEFQLKIIKENEKINKCLLPQKPWPLAESFGLFSSRKGKSFGKQGKKQQNLQRFLILSFPTCLNAIKITFFKQTQSNPKFSMEDLEVPIKKKSLDYGSNKIDFKKAYSRTNIKEKKSAISFSSSKPEQREKQKIRKIVTKNRNDCSTYVYLTKKKLKKNWITEDFKMVRFVPS